MRFKYLPYLLPVVFFGLVSLVEIRKLTVDERPLNNRRIEGLLLQSRIEYFHPVLAFLVQPFWATDSLEQIQYELYGQIDPETRIELTRRLVKIYERLDKGWVPPLLLPAGWEIAKVRAFAGKRSILNIVMQDGSAEASDFLIQAFSTDDKATMEEVSNALLSSKIKRPQLYDKITEANKRGLLPDLRKDMHHILLDVKRGRSETQEALINTTDSAVIQNLLGRYVTADIDDAYAFVFDSYYNIKAVKGGPANWKSSVCAGLDEYLLSQYMRGIEGDKFRKVTAVVCDLDCLLTKDILSIFEEKLKGKDSATKLAVLRVMEEEIPKRTSKYSSKLLDGSIVLLENALATSDKSPIREEYKKVLSSLIKLKVDISRS